MIKLESVIKLNIIIQLGCLCTLFFSCAKPNQETTFFVAGHVYGTPNSTYTGIYPRFKKQFDFIDSQNASFIALTGDMVAVSDKQHWAKFEEDFQTLNTPHIKIPGNHDMGDRALYKSLYKKTDSIFYMNDNTFITLDNTKNGWGLDSLQLQLLKDGLIGNGNLFIFMHNVLWYKQHDCFTSNSLTGKATLPYFNFNSTVLPLLKSSSKNIYLFAGDVGAIPNSKNVAYSKNKNIHFITSGMGNGINDNILKVSISDSAIIEVIPLSLNKEPENITKYTCY